MRMRPQTWRCAGLFFFLGFALAALDATRPRPGPVEVRPPTEFDRLAEVFAPPGVPPLRGKPWVVVDTGPANFTTAEHGWLFADRPAYVKLLDWDGEVHLFRKPVPGEVRPRLKETEGGIAWHELRKPDTSVAWGVRPEDFAARVAAFLAAGYPKSDDWPGMHDMSGGRYAFQAHVIDAARYAHVAHQSGRPEEAARLLEYARKANEAYKSRFGGGFEQTGELLVFIADRVGARLRNGAMGSAHGGTPRPALLPMWEQAAAIPHHKYRDEAREMAAQYRALIAEDRAWIEPPAVAALPPDRQAAYWLHRLRDLAVGQSSDPGTCRILGMFAELQSDPAKPNAAIELKKLGTAAVPLLIAHLDDPRPTRCKGHWRRFSPEGQYLLRYGDCCQQIFQAITGHTLYSNTYPMQDGQGAACKAAAERWWQDFQAKGEK